jgi:Holliday junction resolvasome RuvABC endonuclease subunit
MNSKKTTSVRILAIDPGTREMGIALLEEKKLLYHGVALFIRRQSPHEILLDFRRLILRLIDDFRPDLLAVEKGFFAQNRNTALLNVLVDEIHALGKRKRLRVIGIAASSVKKHVSGDGHAAKLDVAKAMVAAFPELRVYLTQDRKWKERHHQNMFDAVALAVSCRAQLAKDATKRASAENSRIT